MKTPREYWIFKGLKPGDTVYLIRYSEGPVAQVVKKVGATEATIEGSGTSFRLDTGLVHPCAHAKPCKVMPATRELREAAENGQLRKELSRAYGAFTSSRPSTEKIMSVLRVLDPESWK